MQTCQGDFDLWWKNPEKFGWNLLNFAFTRENSCFCLILNQHHSEIFWKSGIQEIVWKPNRNKISQLSLISKKKFDVSENLCNPIKLGELWNPSRLKWVLFRENSDKREILSTKNCEEIVWKIFEKNPIFWIKLCLSNGNAVPKHPNNMSF